jgi:iron complex outermembrane recepter protein
MNTRFLTRTAASLLVIGLVGTPAIAQTAAKAIAKPNEIALEEIVVTARKVEEKLQDVPLSIKALTGEQLSAAGINSISELANATPGLQYSPDFGRSGERPVIRGISALRTEAPQPVSVFVDGVFVRSGALSLLLDDAARVEVVKGPQSALYGRSSYSGAINYITESPGNDFGGRIKATRAEHDTLEAFGVVNIPIVKDVFQARVGAKYYKYGGEYTNRQTGNKVGQEETLQFFGKFVFKPVDSFSATLQANYAKDNDGFFAATIRTIPTVAGGVVTNLNGTTNVANGTVCNGRTLNIVGNNAAGIPDPAVPASLTTRLNGWPCGASPFKGKIVNRNELDFANYTDPKTGINYGNIAGLDRATYRGALTLNYEFGDGYSATSLTSYTRQNTKVGADQSYSGVRFTPTFLGASSWNTFDVSKLSYYSQELRLASPVSQPLQWLVGAFYYNEKTTSQTSDVLKYNFANPTSPTVDPLRPASGLEIRNFAGFGRVQYAISDAFHVSAELRYSEERVKVGNANSLGVAVVTGNGYTAGQPVIFNPPPSTFKTWAPRATIDYKITDDAMVYAQIAKGEKSGGFNATPGLTPDLLTYTGERIWAYEVGLKSEWLDNRLRLNVAAFWNDLSGLQLSNIATYTNPVTGSNVTTTVVNNVGKARTKGFEVEVIARLSDPLTLSANYAFTDAKSLVGTETTNGTAFGGNRSVAGFELPRSPRHSAAAAIAFQKQLFKDHDIDLFARADVNYQSRRYAEIQNLIWANNVARINVAIGLTNDTFKATLFVKNLLDNETSLNGFRYVDPNTFRRTAVDFLARGRQVGATLEYKF